jgi:histidine triad (HIT) family protein
MPYDPNNIFAKILRGDVPCTKIFEEDHVLAFYDIFPKAPVHILVIPKGAYRDSGDFFKRASDAEIVAFSRAVARLVEEHDLEQSGYRLISNAGANGGQEVPHFHMHILGGRSLGPMVLEKE